MNPHAEELWRGYGLHMVHADVYVIAMTLLCDRCCCCCVEQWVSLSWLVGPTFLWRDEGVRCVCAGDGDQGVGGRRPAGDQDSLLEVIMWLLPWVLRPGYA